VVRGQINHEPLSYADLPDTAFEYECQFDVRHFWIPELATTGADIRNWQRSCMSDQPSQRL